MTERRERSFRGISERLAVRYLENLGGERRDAAIDEESTGESADAHEEITVMGDDWRVSLSSETVEVGPSLELNEVTVAFEGDPAALDPLIDQFEQKAMRAGG